jgi:hypothetical protein
MLPEGLSLTSAEMKFQLNEQAGFFMFGDAHNQKNQAVRERYA